MSVRYGLLLVRGALLVGWSCLVFVDWWLVVGCACCFMYEGTFRCSLLVVVCLMLTDCWWMLVVRCWTLIVGWGGLLLVRACLLFALVVGWCWLIGVGSW